MKLSEIVRLLRTASPFPLRAEDVHLAELEYWYRYIPSSFLSAYPSFSSQLGAMTIDDIAFRSSYPFTIVNIINDNQYIVLGSREDRSYNAKYVKDINSQGVGHGTILFGNVPMYRKKTYDLGKIT